MGNLTGIDLGAFELDPQRTGLNHPGPLEHNSLLGAVIEWVNGGGIDAPAVAALRSAMSHPAYSRFFREPAPETPVYRGLAVDGEALGRWLGGIDASELRDVGDAAGSWVVRPRGGEFVNSYTLDPLVAAKFAGRGAGGYKVIFGAWAGEAPGGFLDLYSMLERLDSNLIEVPWRAEKEILALGAVKVNRIWWARKGLPVGTQWGP